MFVLIIDLIRLLFFFGFCLLVCKCQPHYPGCPSGYHFLASGASPPAKGSLASADAFRRLASCKFFLSEDGGPLTVDLRGFLRSSLTSPVALPGITSSRQRASLPAGGSITSNLDATNLLPPATVFVRRRRYAIIFTPHSGMVK